MSWWLLRWRRIHHCPHVCTPRQLKRRHYLRPDTSLKQQSASVWVLYCLMIHGLRKDIRCHVHPYPFFACKSPEQASGHKSNVIADDHFDLPYGFVLVLKYGLTHWFYHSLGSKRIITVSNTQLLVIITPQYWLLTWSTDIAPFLPYPDVVTSSISGSTSVLNSSDKNAGSPIMQCPHGPMFMILSHT